MRPIAAADVVVSELARLLNVWREHDAVPESPSVLAHWVWETAARTPRSPRPEVALDLLQRTGLARLHDDLLHPEALVVGPADLDAPDRVPYDLRRTLFERLLTVSEFGEGLKRVLAWVRIEGGVARVAWRGLTREQQTEPGWRWLQQLGLARHHEDELILAEELLPFVTATSPARRKISPQELEERLAAQARQARLAEEHVVRLEQERLRNWGLPDSAVVHVALEDVAAGYDIQSCEPTGEPRWIEVKSSAGPREQFHLSPGEYETAQRTRQHYWIAWVGWAARLPDGPCDTAFISDPVGRLLQPDSPWTMEPDGWLVRETRRGASG